MRFSEVIRSAEYKPTPYDRTKDKEAAITKMVMAFHKDVEEAVRKNEFKAFGDRSYVQMNEVIKSVGGKPLTTAKGGERDVYVEDFEIPEAWVTEYFKGKRTFGPRVEAAESTGGSEEYNRLKDAVMAAFEVAAKQDKATKSELQAVLREFLLSYGEYGVRLTALKGTITPIADWVSAEAMAAN